jgi:hypothetical protein
MECKISLFTHVDWHSFNHPWKFIEPNKSIPYPLGSWGIIVLKFTMYGPFFPEKLQTEFGKNWNGWYQKAQNIQLFQID